MRSLPMSALLLVLGCGGGGGGGGGPDADGDGFAESVDCDDGNPAVFPGANEVCNGLDDDCSGAVDDFAADRQTFYRDDDGDGYGVDVFQTEGCTVPTGYALVGGDCDDLLATVHPTAPEMCNDLDDDCDGAVDDGAIDAITWYADADGDGSGDPATAQVACDAPPLAIATGGDCDDADPMLNGLDQDGDGTSSCGGDCHDQNPVLNVDDADADAWSTCDGDCDDTDPVLNPGDFDLDGQSSCSGDCDDLDPSVDGRDLDGDGWSTCDGDCDDMDPALELDDADGDGATTCDGDCNDNVVQANLQDLDGDGYDTCSGDCNDSDPLLTPVDADFDGSSTCGGDCDDADPTLEGLDLDGDGVSTCGGDCDDGDPTRFPGSPELCNLIDDDCNGIDDDNPVDERYWYFDGDGDGYGVTATGVIDCFAPTLDHVPFGGDCDDADVAFSPAIPEDCADGLDNDCNGVVDDCIGPEPVDAGLAEGLWWSVPQHRAGEGIAVVDLDADGAAELAIGGPRYAANGGGVWLIHGGPSFTASDELDLAADAIIVGAANGELGDFVGALGDLDGDGYDELGVGAPRQNGDDGVAYVKWGGPTLPTGTLDLTTFEAQLAGDDGNTGNAFTGIGDLDGDGFDDAAVAAPGDNNNHGSLYLIYGDAVRPTSWDPLTTPVIRGDSSGDRICSERCIGAGDLDGDGLSDITFGRYDNGDGDLWILYGDPAPVVGAVTVASLPSFHNPLDDGSNTAWGTENDFTDFDGDGYDELVTGDHTSAIFGADGGAVHLFSGSALRYSGVSDGTATWLTIHSGSGSSTSGAFGFAVEALPDVDGDGLEDLAVGAPWDDGTVTQGGMVRIFAGQITGGLLDADDAILAIGGDVWDSSFGYTVEQGDITGDGIPDLAVGAPYSGDDAGRVYVFSTLF